MSNDSQKSLGEQPSLVSRADRSESNTHDKSLSDDVTFAQEQAKADQANSFKDLVELADRYQLERTLGQGGMGRVDLAIDLRLGRKVAIKRIRESTVANSTSIERFLSEAKAIAALSHPNIVQIYDFGWTKDGPYIIMEYVDGGNLQEATQRGAIPLEQAIDVICRLCDALEKAHNAGIIHRDIKPANILLTKDGIPKLTDFGLAKSELTDAGVTMAGVVLGTLDFMPPEQRRDASLVDARSDLWSLAATLYQIATGKSPKVIRLHELNKSLQSVLSKALEESKEDRYQNAKELKEALRKSQHDAAPVEELAAGCCPHCGTTNPTSRKFCRECGGSLEVNCLSCTGKVSIWEKICDHCGANQVLLLESQRSINLDLRRKAELLLESHDLDKAKELIKDQEITSDPRFRDQATWAKDFIQRLDTEHNRLVNEAVESIEASLKLDAQYKYEAAIQQLSSSSKFLRDEVLPGQNESITAILDRYQAKLSEMRSLEREVRKRVKEKSYRNLLPSVNKFLLLDPLREDFQKLRQQLVAWEEKLGKRKEQALQAAMVAFDDQEYHLCLEHLGTIDDAVADEWVFSLKQEAQANAERAEALDKDINESLRSRRLGNLLNLVEEYLVLKKNDKARESLKEKLLGIVSILREAIELAAEIKFSEALEKLKAIPDEFAFTEIDELRKLYANLEGSRKLAMEAINHRLKPENSLEQDDRDNRGEEGDRRIRTYKTLIREHQLSDEEFMLCEQKTRKSNLQEIFELLLGICVIAVFGLLLYWLVVEIQRFFRNRTWELFVTNRVEPSTEQWSGASNSHFFQQDLIRNSIGMVLKRVQPGSFTMWDRSKPHLVRLTKPYYIGVDEVTQYQYENIMKGNPSTLLGRQNPVNNVSWEDAVEFCKRLSELPEEKAAGRVYRLPTEAEWEYACRAGTTTTYSFGDDELQLGQYAWYIDNSGSTIHPVGQKRPNPWGLYDMHGNVSEWCSDWYSDLAEGEIADPVGPTTAWLRVIRGGSWKTGVTYCQSPNRLGTVPTIRFDGNGFRVAMSPK